MGRGTIPIEVTAYRTVILVTTVAVMIAVSVAALLDFRGMRAQLAASAAAAAPRVERSLRDGDAARALEGLDAVAGAKLYAADGRLIAEAGGGAAGVEIVCSRAAAGGTLCIERSSAPLRARVGLWLRALAAAAAGALVLGILAGVWIRRLLARRISRLRDTIDRAMRERDYSQRAPESRGALGTLSTSMNALLGQVQEREIELKRRSVEVEAANKELESFAYAVSHDLRAPLGSIDGFAQSLHDEWRDRLDESGREAIHWIRKACGQMRDLIEGLLEMSRLSRAELQQDEIDLSSIARSVAERLQLGDPQRQVRFQIREGVRAVGDSRLLRALLENLMANAWKFTRGREEPVIEFGIAENGRGRAFFVRDNGAGFDPSHAAKMFRPFQRLHSNREFEGTGIGLATVQKIAVRHGGKAWAEGEVGKGATVYFTTGS